MNQNTSTADRLRDAVGSVRDVWLDDAEAIFESKQIEKQESGFRHFLHSGWAVAAACLIVAVGVYATIMIVGRGAGGPGTTQPAGPKPPVYEMVTDDPILLEGPPQILVSTEGRMLFLNPGSLSLTYPTVGPDGETRMTSSITDAASAVVDIAEFLPYYDAAPSDYRFAYKDGPADRISFDCASPDSLTITVWRMNGRKVRSGFELNDVTEIVRILYSGIAGDGRMWELHFEKDFDEPLIIELRAEWSGDRGVSGFATYAYIRLPESMADVTKMPTDHGVTVYAYKMAEGADVKFAILADKLSAQCVTITDVTHSYTAAEMKALLAQLGLSPEDVAVRPYNPLISSYHWGPMFPEGTTDEEARAGTAAWRAETEKELRVILGIPLPE